VLTLELPDGIALALSAQGAEGPSRKALDALAVEGFRSRFRLRKTAHRRRSSAHITSALFHRDWTR
jgi:hypothetical protein